MSNVTHGIAMFKVWSISVSIPPFFGWSEYSFSASSYTCASGLGSIYFKFYVSATFPIPILIIFPTYYFILKSSMGATGTAAKNKRHRGNLRTAKIILLIIIIFAVSTTLSSQLKSSLKFSQKQIKTFPFEL